MRKHCLKSLFLVVISVMLVGCAYRNLIRDWKTAFTVQDLNSKVKSGEYVQKVDNFLVILDATGSMAEKYKGNIKVNLARDIVSRMNQTIPDLKLTAGLRTFGRTALFGTEKTKLLYGMGPYTKSGFEGGLNAVEWPRGESPLHLAVNAGTGDLAPLSGKIAVIVVSDGDEDDMNYGAAIKAAKDMKGKLGDRVCIYTIQVGNDPKAKTLLEKIADAGQCGFSVNAEDIASSGDMADFVKKVFLAKAPPKAPEPAKPAVTTGPKDSDGDGVYDDVDQCPGTPKGARVDSRGCWVLQNVLFDFDKSNIKSDYSYILDEAVEVLRKNTSLRIVIQGHTDSIGTADYNIKLSERRAKAVMKYFVKKGIGKERLTTIGYGLTKPIASNKTSEGRALNRRVELKPIR